MTLFDRAKASGITESEAAHLLIKGRRGWVVFPEELQAITGLVRLSGAKRVVETGSYTGCSAGAFLLVCPDVWSIDNHEFFFDEGVQSFFNHPRGPGFSLPLESRHQINFVWGMGAEKLKLLVTPEPRTLFFHDSDHGYKNTLAELTAAYECGASAIAAHDLGMPEAKAAWNDWVTHHKLSQHCATETPLGLGLWLRE